MQNADGPTESNYSKTYGINRRSALLDVTHFPFFDGGLPQDCMHDILEGTASREVKLLLNHCITENYCTLDEYNKSLVYFIMCQLYKDIFKATSLFDQWHLKCYFYYIFCHS